MKPGTVVLERGGYPWRIYDFPGDPEGIGMVYVKELRREGRIDSTHETYLHSTRLLRAASVLELLALTASGYEVVEDDHG